jgi:hypothetical protein
MRRVLPLAALIVCAVFARCGELPNEYSHGHLRYTLGWPDGWASEISEDARYGVQYLTKTGAESVNVQVLYVSTPRLDDAKVKQVADSLAARNPATQTLVSEKVLELTGGNGLQREYTGTSGETVSRSLARYVSTVDGLFILLGTTPASQSEAHWQQIGAILASFKHESISGGTPAQYAQPAGPAPAPGDGEQPDDGEPAAYAVNIPDGWTSDVLKKQEGTLMRIAPPETTGIWVEIGQVAMGTMDRGQLQQMAAVLAVGNPLLASAIRGGELMVYDGVGRAVAYSGNVAGTPYRSLVHLISRGESLYVVIGSAPDSVDDATWQHVLETVRSFSPSEAAGG